MILRGQAAMTQTCRDSAKLILVAVFFCFFSSATFAETGRSEAQWLINLARENNGKTFCAPPTTKVKELADVLAQFSQAHPELNGRITDAQTIQALAEHYPCSLRENSELGNAALSKAGGERLEVAPTGEYASIDMSQTKAVMAKLNGTVAHENDELIKEITTNAGNYMPPVLFSLSALLYRQGAMDEAVFWLNAARLRTMFDAAICTDVSARSAVGDSIRAMPKDLIKYELSDLSKLRVVVERVLKWDEATPYNYDPRYISFHGIKAIVSGLGNAGTPVPLTVPRDSWGAIAKENRDHFRLLMNNMFDQVQRQRSAN
jgi:hypothetical protein